VRRPRFALDFTPAVSQTAGVGRYTRDLASSLLALEPHEIDWVYYRPRNDEATVTQRIPAEHRDRVTMVAIPLPERWLNVVWHRLRLPVGIERFTGPLSLVHGTDFLVPPSRAPSIATIHDLSFEVVPQFSHPKLSAYLRRAVPVSIRRARHVIAVSCATRDAILDHYDVSPAKVSVIHHGQSHFPLGDSDRQVLQVRAQFGIRGPYFLTVGTIEPRKNHLTLLTAFRTLLEQHPDCTLVIAGRPGWLADDIVEAIEDAARERSVLHLQGVSDDALGGLYAGCEAMVYPSWYEGFGLPVIEAMAAGAPVITSDTPALVEVGGDATLTAPAGDSDAFARLMAQVLNDRSLRMGLVERGRRRSAAFDWATSARLHLDLYREVAEGGRSRSD
jgi:glycosyltransferase involved in cell wall biosynthesis